MALSTDTSTSFGSPTGYAIFEATPGDVVISSGATLDAGVFATAAVRTPQLDTSAWGAINSVAATIVEDESSGALYYHRFLASFDDWSAGGRPYYCAYLAGIGWHPVGSFDTPDADLFAVLRERGLSARDLGEVREWPATGPGTVLSFLVGMVREPSGPDGEITEIAVTYGTDQPNANPSPGFFPVLGFEPEFGFTISWTQARGEIAASGGYSQMVERGLGTVRQSTSLTWILTSDSDKATLLAFLRARMNTAFSWQWNGDSASRQWKVKGEPRVAMLGPETWRIEAAIEEFRR